MECLCFQGIEQSQENSRSPSPEHFLFPFYPYAHAHQKLLKKINITSHLKKYINHQIKKNKDKIRKYKFLLTLIDKNICECPVCILSKLLLAQCSVHIFIKCKEHICSIHENMIRVVSSFYIESNCILFLPLGYLKSIKNEIKFCLHGI